MLKKKVTQEDPVVYTGVAHPGGWRYRLLHHRLPARADVPRAARPVQQCKFNFHRAISPTQQ